MFLMQRLANRHATDAFSAQRCADYRSFLRLHLGTDGELTVHPIGVRRVPRRWRYVPSDQRAPSDPVFVPQRGDIEAHLIEAPVVVGRRH
jgi:hypothetical protein